MHDQDTHIIDRVLAGDQDAYADLVKRFHSKIPWVIRSLPGL